MNCFSINQEALSRIKGILVRSNCSNPVAVFIDIANIDKYMGDVKKALYDNLETNEAIKITKEKYSSINEQIDYYMTFIASEKDTVTPNLLFDIEDITFAMSSNVRRYLSNYSLVFEDGRFIFRDCEGNCINNLQEILKTLE